MLQRSLVMKIQKMLVEKIEETQNDVIEKFQIPSQEYLKRLLLHYKLTSEHRRLVTNIYHLFPDKQLHSVDLTRIITAYGGSQSGIDESIDNDGPSFTLNFPDLLTKSLLKSVFGKVFEVQRW